MAAVRHIRRSGKPGLSFGAPGAFFIKMRVSEDGIRQILWETLDCLGTYLLSGDSIP
jgi:hypothetical protein